MRAAWLAVLLLLCGCMHLTPFSPRALLGQRLALRPGWSMALAVDGSVGGRPATIRLAVEEPLSRVTQGCFESSPEVVARVDVGGGADAGPTAGSHFEDQVVAGDVELGLRTLGDVRALLGSGTACEVTLGSEVLIGFVLEVDPGARTVTFHASMPEPGVFQSEESLALELSLDPRTDKPSLAVQLASGGEPLTLPMALATARSAVEVSLDAARALEGKDFNGTTLLPTSLALSPGWALRHLVVGVTGQATAEADAGVPEGGATQRLSGVLGADAWGHFRILLDLRGQHLVLYRRPPPQEGVPGPESWTHLSSDSTSAGALVHFISWQTLSRGGLLPLEPVHHQLRSCRVGLTVAPEDPGVSFEVALPWPGLEKVLPECARELLLVPAWTGELEVAPASRPCTGTCLYAQEVPSGATVCSCSPKSDLAQTTAPRHAPSASPPEGPEPEDPPQPRAPRTR
jgi:hypothetical protein